MGRVGDIGVALHIRRSVMAVTEFPVIPEFLGHDTGAVYKRHDDHAGLLKIHLRRPGEFLLKMVPNKTPKLHYLVYYLDMLKKIATDLTK